MEVKINREIREYTESLFFGLSMRQFVFSVLACGVAVGLYFLLHPYLGMETVSWLCIVGAAPFAAIGFVRYHGMNAEQFLVTWIKSELLIPKRLLFLPQNIYYEALRQNIEGRGCGERERKQQDADMGEKRTDSRQPHGKRLPGLVGKHMQNATYRGHMENKGNDI